VAIASARRGLNKELAKSNFWTPGGHVEAQNSCAEFKVVFIWFYWLANPCEGYAFLGSGGRRWRILSGSFGGGRLAEKEKEGRGLVDRAIDQVAG